MKVLFTRLSLKLSYPRLDLLLILDFHILCLKIHTQHLESCSLSDVISVLNISKKWESDTLLGYIYIHIRYTYTSTSRGNKNMTCSWDLSLLFTSPLSILLLSLNPSLFLSLTASRALIFPLCPHLPPSAPLSASVFHLLPFVFPPSCKNAFRRGAPRHLFKLIQTFPLLPFIQLSLCT